MPIFNKLSKITYNMTLMNIIFSMTPDIKYLSLLS